MPIKLLVKGGPASLYGLVCIVWMYGGRGDFIICGVIKCKFVAFDYGVSMHFHGPCVEPCDGVYYLRQ
jgi:hypothetical protein